MKSETTMAIVAVLFLVGIGMLIFFAWIFGCSIVETQRYPTDLCPKCDRPSRYPKDDRGRFVTCKACKCTWKAVPLPTSDSTVISPRWRRTIS